MEIILSNVNQTNNYTDFARAYSIVEHRSMQIRRTHQHQLPQYSRPKSVVQALVHSKYDLDIPPTSKLSSSLTFAILLESPCNAAALYSDGHIHNMLK